MKDNYQRTGHSMMGRHEDMYMRGSTVDLGDAGVERMEAEFSWKKNLLQQLVSLQGRPWSPWGIS